MPDIYYDVDAALSEVPVNIFPLVSDSDGKTIQGAVAYNAAGMALRWHFCTSAGAYTVTSVTPTTAGTYDWTDQGDSGIYTIEIPASGGASINNDTEGYGWFSGVATGIMPWRSPIFGFRAAAINDALCDGGDILDVSVTQLGGDAQSATDLKDFADAGYDPATNKVQGVLLTDTATNLTNAPGAGDFTATMKTSIGTAVAASAVASVTGNVGGNVAGSVGSVATGGITAGSIAADAIGAAELAADAAAEIAAAVWDLATSGHTTSATFGAQVKTLLDAIAAYIDTEVAAIKNVTDNLPDSGALTSLATAAELAKVPKSDSTVTWNATALASINSQVDTAIVDASFRFGLHAEGTLSGTHSSTTADLGGAAPSTDISGFTLYIPARGFVRIIDSYNTGTGVATFETTSATLTNSDPWYLFATPSASAANPIPVDVKKINAVTVVGAGTSGDKWRA